MTTTVEEARRLRDIVLKAVETGSSTTSGSSARAAVVAVFGMFEELIAIREHLERIRQNSEFQSVDLSTLVILAKDARHE